MAVVDIPLHLRCRVQTPVSAAGACASWYWRWYSMRQSSVRPARLPCRPLCRPHWRSDDDAHARSRLLQIGRGCGGQRGDLTRRRSELRVVPDHGERLFPDVAAAASPRRQLCDAFAPPAVVPRAAAGPRGRDASSRRRGAIAACSRPTVRRTHLRKSQVRTTGVRSSDGVYVSTSSGDGSWRRRRHP